MIFGRPFWTVFVIFGRSFWTVFVICGRPFWTVFGPVWRQKNTVFDIFCRWGGQLRWTRAHRLRHGALERHTSTCNSRVQRAMSFSPLAVGRVVLFGSWKLFSKLSAPASRAEIKWQQQRKHNLVLIQPHDSQVNSPCLLSMCNTLVCASVCALQYWLIDLRVALGSGSLVGVARQSHFGLAKLGGAALMPLDLADFSDGDDDAQGNGNAPGHQIAPVLRRQAPKNGLRWQRAVGRCESVHCFRSWFCGRS